jgi:hypothetical protein
VVYFLRIGRVATAIAAQDRNDLHYSWRSFPRYRNPGETPHPNTQNAYPTAPPFVAVLGGSDQIGVQHHANFATQQVEQDGNALAFSHALEQTEAG